MGPSATNQASTTRTDRSAETEEQSDPSNDAGGVNSGAQAQRSKRSVVGAAVIWAARFGLTGYLVALLVGTHWPNLRAAGSVPGASDKLLHFAAYGGLALLIAIARPLGLNGRRLWAFAGSTILLLGVGTEVTQIFVPGRTFSWLDAVASVGGGLAVLGILGLVGKLCRQVSPGR